MTASVVLRPEVARSAFGWVPMLVGLAVVRSFAALGLRARLKWPNDVVVETDDVDEIPGWGTERKIAGILCEVDDDAVVAGFGINVNQDRDELPVAHATSMLLAGALSLDRGALLGRVVRELDALVAAWERDPASARDLVSPACSTIGRDVVVDVPGANPLAGRAVGLSVEGGLEVRLGDGELRTVLAGDVRVRSAN
jgi:BirA family biotin operon repressor/biotin-[acetyl-CoA-carboxylase] ligase